MRAALAVLSLCIFLLPALAQDTTSNNDVKGLNAYESFHGLVNSSGTLLRLDSSVGWDFNRHFGVFTGMPVYFARSSDNGAPATNNAVTTTRTSDAGVGDLFFGAEAFAPNRVVNYATTLTLGVPTGSESKGFSTGQAWFDWNNRFRRTFGRFTPFFNGGLSNRVPDSDLITRDFTSHGNIAHLEEGAEYDLTKHVYAGASAYQILPMGTQEIFNRLDRGRGGNTEDQPTAVGDNLTRENGFAAWLGFAPGHIWRFEGGYTRSTTFDLNSFSFNIGLNVGRLIRSK